MGEYAAISAALLGPDSPCWTVRRRSRPRWPWVRAAMAIAGGTSEVTRNQIAERILGMPRDPLIK